MNSKRREINIIFSLFVLLSMLSGSLVFRGQDLVPNEDLSLGSSVFVFRQSRKKPQLKSGSLSYFASGSASRANSRRRFSGNLAAYRRKSNQSRNNSNLVAQNPPRRRNQANAKNKLSDALTAQADALLDKNQIDGAILKYKEALKNNPQNQSAKSGLSQANMAKGDEIVENGGSVEAKPFYQEAVNLDETNYGAFVKMAMIDDENNLKDDALLNYEKALKIKADLSELYVPVANLYYEKGDLPAAEIYLAKAEKTSGDEAEKTFLRGLLYRKQNQNEKALAAFIKTLELDPTKAEAYFYQAEIYDQMNQNQKAIAAYQKTVEVDPQFAQAWFDLGVANYNQGNYQEAAAAYDHTIALDKNNADAHANLASTYRQLEKYTEANGEYKIAAETYKDDADLFSEWGYCLGKVDEWDKAVARLETAKNLSPDAIDYTNLGWGFYNAAQKEKDSNRKDEAQAKYAQGKEALQKAVELNPKFDAAYLNLGITYTGLGEYQNAVETLTKANSLHQNWIIAVNELGVAYRKLNKLTDAISQFERTVRLDDKFALGYFNLGEAQNKLGRKKEAKKTLERLKQLNPDLANKLDDVLKGAVIDETKQQIRKRLPRIPF